MLIHSRSILLCPKLLGLLLLHSICAAGISAQAPNNTSPTKPAPTSAQTGTTIKLRVNLVQVRVVVRDSKGNLVPGLTREDFQVSDNGKPQVITNFSVETRESRLERSEAAARTQVNPPQLSKQSGAILPDRFVLIVFDDARMEVGDLILARKAAAKFTESLAPTDRVALATTTGHVGHDFTGSPEDIRAALVGVSGRPDAQTAQKALQSAQPEAPPVQVTRRDGPQGDPILGGHAYAQQEAAEHVTQAYTADSVRRLSRMPGERILVLITPGFSIRLGSSELLGLIDAANDAKVVVNTLDVRGLYVPNLAAKTPNELRQGLIDQRELSTGPLALAQETGGTFSRDSNDLIAGLRLLGSTPEVSYLLGFSPQDVKLDGSYHKLKVTVTRLNRFGDPLYDTQARRGYFVPMEGGDPRKESHDELQDALFSQDEIRDFPFALQTQYVKNDAGAGQLDILAHLQMKEVPFRVLDGRHVDSVTVATSIFDDNGNFVTGGQKVLDLNLLEPSYQKMVQAGLTIKTSFDLKPGKYMVRQVVRDSENFQMAARNGTAVIPD